MHKAGQIDALGRRFRDNISDEEDIRMLEAVRAEYDSLLLETANWTRTALGNARIESVFAGRSKRTKSLKRKLARPQNRGMDLSRMADLVGLRVVVRNMQAQRRAADALSIAAEERNYLDDELPYRAIHVITKEDMGFRMIETQIRTVPQQLWANESESFGEQVKEGGGPTEIREYLQQLSGACRCIDHNQEIPTSLTSSTLFVARGTLSFRLPQMEKNFDEAIRGQRPGTEMATCIAVYDNSINQCTQEFRYEPGERMRAIEDYQRITRSLDDTRYETLIFNSSSDATLRVTHPRFFPEG